MDEKQLNIIIAGKSGVGKSSFLNYLIGAYKFETGNGEPVTQDYFQKESYTTSNKITYNLYDTKGLEPGECQKSKQIIIDEIEKRDKESSMYQWIHSVYYCIAATSHRAVEPFEINFIKDLKEKCSVVVLLTKADKVSAEELSQMKQALYREFTDEIQIIPVCSVPERTRRGTSTQFGRDEVLRASFLGLWDKLALTLPEKLTGTLNGNYVYPKPRASSVMLCLMSYLSEETNLSSNEIWSIVNGKRNNTKDQNHLDILCFLSNMSIYIDLDKYDRNAIKELMSSVNESLVFFRVQFENFNVDSVWEKQEQIIQSVFDFYDKINENNNKKVLFLHRAKMRLNMIKKYDVDSKINDIKELEYKVRDKLKEVEGCLIFDSDEKKSVMTSWNSYRDAVILLGYELKELFFKFEATFEAELYQYGQYCIREY